MHKETWQSCGDILDVGDAVEVVVEKLWKADLYRWPIQLRAIDPNIQQHMSPSIAV